MLQMYRQIEKVNTEASLITVPLEWWVEPTNN